MSALVDALRRLPELSALPEGWDDDGAPPPNETAAANARSMLHAMDNAGGVVDDDVDADVMGGLALYYAGATGRTLWIACHNHGTVVVVGRDRDGKDGAPSRLARLVAPTDAAGLVMWLNGGAWPA